MERSLPRPYPSQFISTLGLVSPPDFMLEKDVREVYGLPLSEIAKQIERGLTMDLSRHQFPGQHPVTPRRIQPYCQLSPQSQPTSKTVLFPRLTPMYRKSIPLVSNRQARDQKWWLPLSEPLGPSSILLTNIGINHPRNIGAADMAGGRMLPTSREACPDPCWPSSCYISAAVKPPGGSRRVSFPHRP